MTRSILRQNFRRIFHPVRGVLAKSVTEAARFVAERGLVEEGAPVVVRFITQVASRFGVVLTQKFAAQALPVVGALGGASVNYLFIEHFQETAQGQRSSLADLRCRPAGGRVDMERTL
jgi:EcsC protein family